MILFPDLASKEEPAVARLKLAYIMFNQLDKAEFAIRVLTPIEGAKNAVTPHYSKVIRMQAKNELFSLTE